MTRSRKMSGKLTTKQLQAELNTTTNEFRSFANAMIPEVMKHSALIYAVLEEMGKMEKITCANCKEEVARPTLSELEQNDDCPACGKNLFGTEQTSLDDILEEE